MNTQEEKIQRNLLNKVYKFLCKELEESKQINYEIDFDNAKKNYHEMRLFEIIEKFKTEGQKFITN